VAALRRHVQGFTLYPGGDFFPLKDVWLGPSR